MKKMKQLLLIIGLVLVLVTGKPIVKHEENLLEFGARYLMQYGYLLKGEKRPTDSEMKKAIFRLQEFFGLKQTGELDTDTVTLMQMPRCGEKDVEPDDDSGTRHKRYATMGGKWRSGLRVFGIFGDDNYPEARHMSKERTEETIVKAFQIWEDQINDLTFRLATEEERKSARNLDFGIRFASYRHGDMAPFDGAGGALAHAYFPTYGRIHFDKSEWWTLSSSFFPRINLYQVAVHEIGHALGLAHSRELSAVMTPVYYGYKRNFKLHEDDIKGIQSLYGKNKDLESSSDDDDDDVDPADNHDDEDDPADFGNLVHFPMHHVHGEVDHTHEPYNSSSAAACHHQTSCYMPFLSSGWLLLLLSFVV